MRTEGGIQRHYGVCGGLSSEARAIPEHRPTPCDCHARARREPGFCFPGSRSRQLTAGDATTQQKAAGGRALCRCLNQHIRARHGDQGGAKRQLVAHPRIRTERGVRTRRRLATQPQELVRNCPARSTSLRATPKQRSRSPPMRPPAGHPLPPMAPRAMRTRKLRTPQVRTPRSRPHRHLSRLRPPAQHPQMHLVDSLQDWVSNLVFRAHLLQRACSVRFASLAADVELVSR